MSDKPADTEVKVDPTEIVKFVRFRRPDYGDTTKLVVQVFDTEREALRSVYCDKSHIYRLAIPVPAGWEMPEDYNVTALIEAAIRSIHEAALPAELEG